MTRPTSGQRVGAKPTYEARGDVRGSCGHAHRTIGAAQQCAQRDYAAIRRTYGGDAYSDRQAARTDGLPFTDAELVTLAEDRP